MRKTAGFLGQETFSAETRKLLGKLRQAVTHLPSLPTNFDPSPANKPNFLLYSHYPVRNYLSHTYENYTPPHSLSCGQNATRVSSSLGAISPHYGFHEALRRAPNCSHSSSITKAKIRLKPLVGEVAPPWEGRDWGAELWFAHVQLPLSRWP